MAENIGAYMLYSSSRGNVAYVKCGSDEILIDAGVSARRICCALNDLGTSIENIKAIFVTHEHRDHINGLKIISKYYKIPVYAPFLSAKSISETQPETEPLINSFDDGDSIALSDMSINAVATSHDSLASVGFKIDLGRSCLGYATDIGHLSDSVQKMLTGCEYVVIESNHDIEMLEQGEYPYFLKKRILGSKGHLSNMDCAEFLPGLVRQGAKSIVLAHLSENNNRPQIAFGECRGRLAASGMRVCAERSTGDVVLTVAQPACAVKIV